MKFRRAKKLGLARVTLTNKGASVSRVKLKELAKAELKKSAKSKGGSKAKAPVAETTPLKRATKKKVLPSRVSTVAISGDVPTEWKPGSGVFEGLFWTGKKWVKVKPNASDASAALSARSEGLPKGWRRGSGAFAGQIWNGKKWTPDPNGS